MTLTISFSSKQHKHIEHSSYSWNPCAAASELELCKKIGRLLMVASSSPLLFPPVSTTATPDMDLLPPAVSLIETIWVLHWRRKLQRRKEMKRIIEMMTMAIMTRPWWWNCKLRLRSVTYQWDDWKPSDAMRELLWKWFGLSRAAVMTWWIKIYQESFCLDIFWGALIWEVWVSSTSSSWFLLIMFISAIKTDLALPTHYHSYPHTTLLIIILL